MIAACFVSCRCRVDGHTAAVCRKCLHIVVIYMMVMYLQNTSSMCMCMPVLLAEDSEFWAFAMLSQQGARATLEGTDGLNSLSPWFTIQTDRERNKEPERQSTTERDLIIEMEKKKPSKKGTLLLQS